MASQEFINPATIVQVSLNSCLLVNFVPFADVYMCFDYPLLMYVTNVLLLFLTLESLPVQDTMRGLLIMRIPSSLCIMFVSMMSTNSCKLRNPSIFFFHMIGLLASLIVGTGSNLFDTNPILRRR